MLTFNNRQFAPLHKGIESGTGYYRKTRTGVYLYDTNKDIFAFMRADFRFTGIVSASRKPEGIWHMFALTERDEKRLGLDSVSYSEEKRQVVLAIESLKH